MKPAALPILVALFLPGVLTAQSRQVASDVYAWNAFKSQGGYPTEKEILRGRTKFLESLVIVTLTLAPHATAEPSSAHPDVEELVIVKDGTLKVTQNGRTRILGPGSIALTIPGDMRQLENNGDTPATYYRLTYKSAAPADPTRATRAGGSLMIDRETIGFHRHAKGGIWRYFDRPTTMLKRMEMHVTLLNEDQRSHDPHRHNADEIVLLISGRAEMQIDRDRIGVTPGSVVFLNSMVPHAITNTGRGPCEYFAFQWE